MVVVIYQGLARIFIFIKEPKRPVMTMSPIMWFGEVMFIRIKGLLRKLYLY